MKLANTIIDSVNGLKSIEQGAARQLQAATNPKLDGLGGVYAEDCEIADITPEISKNDADINKIVLLRRKNNI